MSSRLPASRRALLAGALGLLLAACEAAAGAPAIAVNDAWIPQPAGPNGAAYLTLANTGDIDDRLLTVETDAAGDVQIHESTLDGGVMSMQEVNGVAVPAGETVLFEPGGLHVMLLDVRTDLEVGDTVPLTLTFESSGELTVEGDVVPLIGGDTASEHGASEHAASEHAS
jgi:hypothetical protein